MRLAVLALALIASGCTSAERMEAYKLVGGAVVVGCMIAEDNDCVRKSGTVLDIVVNGAGPQ